MNMKTNITHKYSYLTVNVKPRAQTITQFMKRNFSYQLFVIGAVMTKACGEGGSYVSLATDGFDVIAQYNQNPGIPFVLTNTPEDDTQVSGELEVLDGEIGASGYDTVLVQGYTGADLNPVFTGSDVILISPSGGSKPDIKFTFENDDFFERFVFDINGDGQIDGNDFTWLVGKFDGSKYEIEGTNVKDYIRGFGIDDILGIERTGDDLKLTFKESSGGGSIIIKDSFNNDEQGIDKIFFDTDNDGIEDTIDTIWEDDASFASYIDGA